MLTTFTLTLALLTPTAPVESTASVTPVVTPAAAPAAVHCQVPCGIYGDHLRIELLKEHAATIEKAMGEIERLGAEGSKNFNQIVRWVTTKDEHAQAIQDQLGDYWLAQRIKAPVQGGAAGMEKYTTQLVAAHGMITAAMKCKQTTDTANVASFLRSMDGLAAAYFSTEDLQHLRGHGADGADGAHGADGHDGADGAHGADGHDGADHDHSDGGHADHDHDKH